MSARIHPWARLVPLALLVGCASSGTTVIKNPAPSEHEIVGAGTSDDRTVITNSDQQIYNTEHAETPPAAGVPNQGLP